MDMKLELVPVPVSDVDRAKAFYTEMVGFREDVDQRLNEKIRFVQLTPTGSSCSIAIGEGITMQEPGSLDGLLLVVKDINAAHDELSQHGVQVSKPAMQPWGTIHADFADPDGNRWTLQQPADRRRSADG
jgi:predicted enzyme related to lactoylglutathione lyase